MNHIITTLSLLLISLLLLTCTQKAEHRKHEKMNFLLIIIDDLRPQLGAYGKEIMKTPSIDQLADEGVTFERTYCQVPVCGASRASMLTGIRPTRNRYKNYYTYAEKDAPNAISLPGLLKNHGYITLSRGKVFHNNDDHQGAWSEAPWQSILTDWKDYALPEHRRVLNAPKKTVPPVEAVLADDSIYRDGRIANKVVDDLQHLSNADQPFFLAAGFVKPHLPFNAPQKYWDMYDSSVIKLARNLYMPENAPELARHHWNELRFYKGIPRQGDLDDSTSLRLIHGYYAATSYVDAQIGKVLTELKHLSLDETTTVILVGDHGWSLGEHTLWCKHSTFHNAIHVPMIISSPNTSKGQRSGSLSEMLDIFPTVCDLAGIQQPAYLQGKSLVPILNNVETEVKTEAFVRLQESEALVTEKYVYTEWFDKDRRRIANMLYDHSVDSEENLNIADMPEHAELVQAFREKLNKVNEESTLLNLP